MKGCQCVDSTLCPAAPCIKPESTQKAAQKCDALAFDIGQSAWPGVLLVVWLIFPLLHPFRAGWLQPRQQQAWVISVGQRCPLTYPLEFCT